MLTLLKISGFALIDEAEIAFGPGLTAVTGETGAGKSILVEALGLLRGARAGADLIRAGSDEARVEAIVELPETSTARARLLADGRAYEDGLVVRRTIARGGRGRAHLGGSLATAADLAALVRPLVDIASQHDQQSLTDPESQLAILDAFAENAALHDEMAAAYAARTTAAAALAGFAADARARAEREDLLRFQLGELEAARPVPGEEQTLAAERERLRGAEKFYAATAGGEETLYAGDGAVSERIAGVLRDLEPLAALDPALAPQVERLSDAAAAIDDVARDLGRYARGVRSDPARLAEIEERLFLLSRLCRKHGGTVADLAARRETLAAELAEVARYDDALAARQAAADAANTRAVAAAAALTASRKQAALSLEKKVSATLRELGFATARLPVVLFEARELGPAGADRVRFLFAPNPGEEPKPLARIASGGELSRVMLAVKQALARTDQVLTYVFDEVDAGVGGGAAEVIGRKLKRIAADRQVIVITHLAQVAAFADAHVRVTKSVVRGKTRVAIETLGEADRAGEIARMLAGAAPSPQAAAHADEMLRAARQD
ncbi:MAG TPA: DNA repair protein RecN [Polyangia bacterium]|nr:DNA repair protein RecN [Polyangia bacterium]